VTLFQQVECDQNLWGWYRVFVHNLICKVLERLRNLCFKTLEIPVKSNLSTLRSKCAPTRNRGARVLAATQGILGIFNARALLVHAARSLVSLLAEVQLSGSFELYSFRGRELRKAHDRE
jgi:hypothetical protein